MFDPDESARGLGHLTLLSEISYAQHTGKRFVYTGYAHTISSYYDYKKRYRGTEFYDWKSAWHSLDALRPDFFPTHRYEMSDIPAELLEEEEHDDTDLENETSKRTQTTNLEDET